MNTEMETQSFGSQAVIHRIGGCRIDNLRLKPKEQRLNPPGISVFVGGSPREAADQIRERFPHAARLHEAAQIVASATIESIRQAGFDVIAVPTRQFANRTRLFRPDGVAGFDDQSLARLSNVFRESTGVDDAA